MFSIVYLLVEVSEGISILAYFNSSDGLPVVVDSLAGEPAQLCTMQKRKKEISCTGTGHEKNRRYWSGCPE
ncbi:MAG: hypothetical protein PHF18_08050 [Methanosarcina sp.]|uniref:hypothetical protein n=1 Tax=Methanosarcina sp. TaxID=2213 RepID=UPI00261F3A0C|nr:hypothetical protein [Methanosarcina sp.]MDD3246786.1 hypothetical protein [Methanosarcina sp.]